MIDADGFRANVGIVICNQKGQVFWARRYGQNSWQFPQGGIDPEETLEQSMYRELMEEVGLLPTDVNVLAKTKLWLKYRLPKRYIRQNSEPVCIGQKQKWFLLNLCCDPQSINLSQSEHPEFDHWRWVSYWYPVRQVIPFKREVYRNVMKEFSSFVLPNRSTSKKKYRNSF